MRVDEEDESMRRCTVHDKNLLAQELEEVGYRSQFSLTLLSYFLLPVKFEFSNIVFNRGSSFY